jgi:hypothetical protein
MLGRGANPESDTSYRRRSKTRPVKATLADKTGDAFDKNLSYA